MMLITCERLSPSSLILKIASRSTFSCCICAEVGRTAIATISNPRSVERFICSPVASSLFRSVADREPIEKRDGERAGKDHHLRDVHPCDQNTREHEAKYTEQHSRREPKGIRTGPLSPHHNESSGNRAVNEQPGSSRQGCVPAKSSSGRKQEQQHRKGDDGQVWGAEARMDCREKAGEIAPFTHRKCKTRCMQHARAHIAVNANQSAGTDERYTKRSKKPPRRVHGRLCTRCRIRKSVNHDVLHCDIQ